MESKAKLFGHPAHTILVVFPLGLLATSVVFDIAGELLDKPELVASGFWMASAGCITGLVAAIPGLIDYLAIPGGTRAKKIGLLHGVGNVVVLGLFAGSVALRGTAPHSVSRLSTVLSLTGVALAMVTGWLGGELVDRLGVGVDDNANLNAPNSLTHGRIVSKI